MQAFFFFGFFFSLNEAIHGKLINVLYLPGCLIINIFLGHTEDLVEHFFI